MNLTKNLTSYKSRTVERVKVNGEAYLTNTNFNPRYILGQAFGGNSDEQSYNFLLAQNVSAARKYFSRDLPAIVQAEIGECMKRLGEGNFHVVGEVYRKEEKALAKSKIDTREILSKSKKIADKLDLPYNSVLFIAHPYHVQRVMNNAKKIGLSGEPFIREKIEWPKEDLQPWVRGPLLWIPREIVARILKK